MKDEKTNSLQPFDKLRATPFDKLRATPFDKLTSPRRPYGGNTFLLSTFNFPTF
jgi:hypothetical protein